MRHKCVVCGKLTERWQRVNGGSWHCYDGCYSTTGWDRRQPDGIPHWIKEGDGKLLGDRIAGKELLSRGK